jgi:hypothetical protein
MTFTLMFILNVVLDLAILGALAFLTSRAPGLRPNGESAAARAAVGERVARERGEHVASPLRPLLD